MKTVFFYNYPLGRVAIAENNGAICRILFTKANELAGFTIEETPLIQKAAEQLGEYFAGERRNFDLPLSLNGSDFQTAVWDALRTIPCGETRSYGQIAKTVGDLQAARAVGIANSENPILIVIPCHRVIKQDGSLGGYVAGQSIKESLLALERKNG